MVNALFSFPMNLYCFASLIKNSEFVFFFVLHIYINKIVPLTGAKSITKAMEKVAYGPQGDEGTKRFSELSDKELTSTIL